MWRQLLHPVCKNEPVGIFKLGWGIKITGNYGFNGNFYERGVRYHTYHNI